MRIERRSRDPAIAQRLDERGLLNDRPARRIQEKRGSRQRETQAAFLSNQVLDSGRRWASCACKRATMLECICDTRDSLRSSVAPISFIVMSS